MHCNLGNGTNEGMTTLVKEVTQTANKNKKFSHSPRILEQQHILTALYPIN
jgi:hypothetical protein